MTLTASTSTLTADSSTEGETRLRRGRLVYGGGDSGTEICPFFTFTLVRQTCFAYNFFFGAYFYNFFNGFEISVKFCVFLYLFYFFAENFFLGYTVLALFENFEAKRAINGSKKQKNVFSICVLDFNFAPIKGFIV